MKVKNTIWDNVIETICWVLVIGIPVYLILNWQNIPSQIPMHFDAAGNIDRWGDKGELIILPIISLMMCIFLSIIERFPQVWNTGVKVTEENQERVYRVLKNLMKTIKLITLADFAFMTITSIMGRSLPIWFTPVFVGLVFGDIIFWLVKLVRVK